MYAEQLTKEMLLEKGIIEVSEDGKHIYGKLGIEFKQTPSNSGHLLAAGIPVHRLVYAWFKGEATGGLVVDHINNIKTDNRIENLQLLTPGQNIWKDRVCNVRQLKCKMNKPRSFYEDMLKDYLALYEQAKKNKQDTHKLRANISQTRARLRYWDDHKEEYEAFIEETTKQSIEKEEFHRKAKYRKEFASWKKYFRKTNNKLMWRQLLVIEELYWNEWSADKIEEKLNKLTDYFKKLDSQAPNF